jgi:hypothetical protein
VRHDPDAITAALDEVYAATDSDVDPALAAVAQRLLQRVEW